VTLERSTAASGGVYADIQQICLTVPCAHHHLSLMSTPAIDIQGIVKRYENHVAVRSLSLNVPRGAVYGLLGPNGAGKTTTIRMMLNIIAPDEGAIRVLGLSHDDPTLVDRIGYLPEERGLYRKMQVRRVLQFLGELKGMPRGKVLDRAIDEWLEPYRRFWAERYERLDDLLDELQEGQHDR